MTNELKTIPIKATTTREDANRVIERNRAAVWQSVQEKLREYKMSQPVCDLCFGFYSIGQRNPYDEIINMANYITCALSDGCYFFFEAERLRRELAALKGRRIEAIECKEVR